MIDYLQELISSFEHVYAETGAGASIELRNLETGDSSDVVLLYMRQQKNVVPGLYVSISGRVTVRLEEAAPMIMARAAKHLPDLADRLDDAVVQIEAEVVGGTVVLEEWFKARGLS